MKVTVSVAEIGALVSDLVRAQGACDRFAEAVAIRSLVNRVVPAPVNTGHTKKPRLWMFMEKVVFGMSQCWYWRGGLDSGGYGTVSGAENKAHRRAWRLFRGPIPPGLKVLHKCDVRSCVNPDHLFLGTQLDNVHDMVAKGRDRHTPMFGERNPMARLTLERVEQIREMYAGGGWTMKRLAAEFGVTTMTVHRAVRRHTWAASKEESGKQPA